MRGEETHPGDRTAHGRHRGDQQHGDGQRREPRPLGAHAQRLGVLVAQPHHRQHRRAQHEGGDRDEQPRPEPRDVVPGPGGQGTEQIAVDELEVELVGHDHQHEQRGLQRGSDRGAGQQYGGRAAAQPGGEQGQPTAERGPADGQQRLDGGGQGQGQHQRSGHAQRGPGRHTQHLRHRQGIAQCFLQHQSGRPQTRTGDERQHQARHAEFGDDDPGEAAVPLQYRADQPVRRDVGSAEAQRTDRGCGQQDDHQEGLPPGCTG
jgi:hypothetical protein